MIRTRIKVCGITRLQDALHAAEAGADYVGFVFAPSPRQADAAAARAIAGQLAQAFPEVGRVGVFVHPGREEVLGAVADARLTHVQIHGAIPEGLPESIPLIVARGLAARPASGTIPPDTWGLLVEPQVAGLAGGTGIVLPWEWARAYEAHPRLFVAGGLDAERVTEMLRVLRPYGVDASSRLEIEPGVKDPQKVAAFVRAVRRRDAEEARTDGARNHA